MKKKSVILVVDDEDQNLKVLEAMLISQGYIVKTSNNGIDALKKVDKENPDLILLDIMMPGMNGFEVVKSLKENKEAQNIPIVMVTALSEIKDKVKALDVGANDFLNKPVDKTELRARVRSLLKVKKYNDYMKNYQQILEDEVNKRTKLLKQTFDKLKIATLETIIRLSRAAEFKDDYTGLHIMRMSHYSKAIAKNLGLSSREEENILHAAPMHDIGKIGIPDKILLKPGKLNSEEWEIMKKHSRFGAKILEGSSAEVIKIGETIALTHHEKWNGKGYPQGLIGEKIPIEGRIVAICDAFDAMTSKRPYKDPYSVEETFKIIKQERGSQFDPNLVDIFFSIKDKILKIKKVYDDHGESLMFRTINELV